LRLGRRARIFHQLELEDDSLQSLFEHAPAGIAKVGLDGRFLVVNRKLSEIFGYPAEELTRLRFQDLTHPDDLARSVGWLDRFRDGTLETVKAEKRYLHKSSQVVTVDLAVAPVHLDGQLQYFVSVFDDASERKRAEGLLHRQKQVLELMAKNVSLAETLTSIVRLVEEQAPGVLSAIFLIEDGRLRLGVAPSFPEVFARAFDGLAIGPEGGTCGAAAHFKRRVVSLDVAGDPVWGGLRELVVSYGISSAWSTPVLSGDGRVLATVSMCWKERRTPTVRDFELVDVATHLMGLAIERTHAERLIVEQQVKLVASSKMAALGEMAGGLAHEINNPLAIIHAKASLLEMLAADGTLAVDEVVKTAEKIRATAMRISTIIKGLRSFARDAEHDPFQIVAASSLLGDTLELCRQRFKNHDVDVRLPLGVGEAIILECQPVQLVQVLLNLLSNSYDAVLELPDKWIELTVEAEGDQVVFSVTDSGHGIPAGVRDKITQPFFTTKEAGKGTGLGLSIAAGIVTSHDGTLALDATAAHTRFVVRLPARQRAAST